MSSSSSSHKNVIKTMKKIFLEEITNHNVEYKNCLQRNAYFGIIDDKRDPKKDYNELATCLRIGCEIATPIDNPEGKYDYILQEGLNELRTTMLITIDKYKKQCDYFFLGKRRVTHEIKTECNFYLLTFYVIIPKQK